MNLVTMRMAHRVFLISYNDFSGTAFTMENSGRQFLITAKHVVQEFPDRDLLLVRHDGLDKSIHVTALKHPDEEVDVIAFELPSDLSPRTEINFSRDKIITGQDVFVMGFPHDMATDWGDMNRKFPGPLFLKGIYSGEYNGFCIVDGFSDVGLSGAPVIFNKALDLRQPSLLGVLQSSQRLVQPVVDENDEETGHFVLVPTGLAYVTPFDRVDEIFQHHGI